MALGVLAGLAAAGQATTTEQATAAAPPEVEAAAGGEAPSIAEAPAAAEPPSGGPAPAAGEAPAADEPLAFLAAEADPFAGRPFLQARALRGLPAQVAGEVLAGEPGGEIALAVLAVPVGWGEEGAEGEGVGRVEVRLFVEIDGASFLSHNQAEVARIEVYAYALADRSVAGYTAEAFAVPVGELGEVVWQSGLKVHGRLGLPPGRYVLRVLVRNAASGARGLAEVPLEVPHRPTGRLVFADPGGRDAWLPVRGWEIGGHPFVGAGGALVPAARPVLVAGRQAEGYLVLSGPWNGSVAERLEVLPAAGEGEPLATAQLSAGGIERPPAESGGPALLPLRFRVPELPSGDYRVRFPHDPVSARVTVAPAGPQEQALLWTDLRWLLAEAAGERTPAGAEAAARAPVPQARRGGRRRLRRLENAYREALAPVAEHLTSAVARTAVLDLESTALAGSGPERMEALAAAELAVARDLAEAKAESLLPLVALHHDLYLTYRGRRLFALAAHTLAHLERLAELYGQRGGEPERAAQILAVLGGYQQEALLVSSSRRLFLRALTHDPAGTAALMGLAASCEKYGEYGAAVELLDRLVAARPGSAEGRLRLAVNLARTGQRDRARRVLERIAAAPNPPWVDALAREELARGLIGSGQLEEAQRVLEAGDGAAGSRLLLAHVYDRQGRYREALALLGDLEPGGAGAAGSPRRRYDTWPEEELVEARRELTAAAGAGLPALARALDGDGR